ncbi:UNVERIFIED_CONTAM: Ferrochelatase-2, chloroplastic [Sesamum angustifolium]|uniref:Ferrochelatase n=1 Tax=Sesamum angustifolium TaxID=2727405 RepID=A0AAW2MBP8_9LAMI
MGAASSSRILPHMTLNQNSASISFVFQRCSGSFSVLWHSLISVLRALKSKEAMLPLSNIFCFSLVDGFLLGLNHLISVLKANAIKLALETKEVPANVYVAMRQLSHLLLRNFGNSLMQAMIFFSAHGVPVSYVEDAGDPYKDQMEECIFLIMQELKCRGINNDHTLAFQSRVGPVEWLKPYTDEVLVELGKQGIKSLLAVPVSFVSEHIETLEEIDMEYKELALESGIVNWGRVPALNCTPSFITDLADALIEALPSAMAISTSNTTSEEAENDIVGYAIKLLFGSILAFILLLSPKVILAFRNYIP